MITGNIHNCDVGHGSFALLRCFRLKIAVGGPRVCGGTRWRDNGVFDKTCSFNLSFPVSHSYYMREYTFSLVILPENNGPKFYNDILLWKYNFFLFVYEMLQERLVLIQTGWRGGDSGRWWSWCWQQSSQVQVQYHHCQHHYQQQDSQVQTDCIQDVKMSFCL